MRSVLLAAALALVSTTATAQRVTDAPVTTDTAAAAQLTVASSALFLAPAPRPWTPAPAPQGMGMSGGRVVAILIGAAIGAGVVYLAVGSIDCQDCDGNAQTYGAIGGAVVGGFIGSVVYSYRQRRAVTPPSSFRP